MPCLFLIRKAHETIHTKTERRKKVAAEANRKKSTFPSSECASVNQATRKSNAATRTRDSSALRNCGPEFPSPKSKAPQHLVRGFNHSPCIGKHALKQSQ